MADIFTVAPGTVVAVDSPGIPLQFFLEDWGGYPAFKSIITGFQVQTRSGVQFLHTLRDFIYVYSFGERIGDIRIQGISFAFNHCDLLGNATFHGLEYVLGYYLLNRVASRPTPVTVVLGGATPFFAFLQDVQMSLTSSENMLGQFSYGLKVIPVPGALELIF